MRRFRAPDKPEHLPLGYVPGLGQDKAQTEDFREEEQTGMPFWYRRDSFYNQHGRNRFRVPAPYIPVGHGMDTEHIIGGRDETDSAKGKGPFHSPELPIEIGPYVDEDRPKPALGTRDKETSISFHRRLEDNYSYQAALKLQPSFLASGPSPKSRWWNRIIYRKEFLQEAQYFDGEHTFIEPGVKYSTTRREMMPPIRSKLSSRTIPAAYGLGTLEYGD